MRISDFFTIKGLPVLGLAFFCLQMQFWFPVWVLFLLERGISLSEIVVADMIFWTCVIIFEVPAGMFGDRVGRKRTYFIGAILGALSYFFMILINDFSMLILCWIIWSVYIAIVSGTDTAFIYEILKTENQLENSTFVFGYFSAISSVAFIVTHFTAGFLYQINSSLPIFLNIIVSLLAASLILKLPDPTDGNYETTSFTDVVNAMKKQFLTNRVLKYAIIIMSVFLMYHWTLTLIFQPLLIGLNIEVEYFGYFYFFFTILGILAGVLAGPLEKRFGQTSLLIFSFFIVFSSVGITAWIPGLLSVVGIMWLRFGFFLGQPVLQATINHEIDDTHRASVFSFTNMLYSLMLVFSRPLVGFITELWNVKLAYQVWFLLGIPIMIILFILVKKMNINRNKPLY